MTHRLRLGALLVLAVVLLAACGTAATPTSSVPEATTQAPTATQPAAATTITESTPGNDWRSKGAASAPVVIEEYSDFQ